MNLTDRSQQNLYRYSAFSTSDSSFLHKLQNSQSNRTTAVLTESLSNAKKKSDTFMSRSRYKTTLNDSNSIYNLSSNRKNVIVKQPFKHFDKQSNEQDENSNEQTLNSKVDPAKDLVRKTIKSIAQFSFKIEIEKQQANGGGNSKSQSFIRQNPRNHYSIGYGLRPLHIVDRTGPNINQCLGILKEPSDNNVQLKEIYDRKVQLLARKRQAQSLN